MFIYNIKSIDASEKSKDTIKNIINEGIVSSKIENKNNTTKISFEGPNITKNLISLLEESLNKTFTYTNLVYQKPEKESENENLLEYKLEKKENNDINKLKKYETFLTDNKVLLEYEIKPYYNFIDFEPLFANAPPKFLKKTFDKLYEDNLTESDIADLVETTQISKKIYFSAAATNKIDEYNKKELNDPDTVLPFYNKLTIPIPKGFVNHYSQLNYKNIYFKNIFSFYLTQNALKKQPVSTNSQEITDLTTIYEDNLRVVDVSKTPIVFVNNFYLNDKKFSDVEEAARQSVFETEIKSYFIESFDGPFAQDSFNRLNRNLGFPLIESLEPVIKDNKNKILSNNPTNFEPLFIKIEKFIGSSRTPIQEFYFSFNELSPDNLEFIDNQIFLSKSYRYVVKLISVVYDYSYSYNKITDNTTTDSIGFECISNVNQKIVEIPYFTQEVNGFGNALVIPDVYFHTNKNNPKEVKISLKYLNAITTPSSISQADATFFSILQDKEGKVVFDDEKVDFCQIYRLVDEPKNLKDFSLKEYQTFNLSDVFVDIIENNKDYYYVFQFKTLKNKFSNPSYVYKVNLKFINGTFDPQISIFEIKGGDQALDKYRKKYLKIKNLIKLEPSFFQKSIKEIGADGTYKYSDIQFVIQPAANTFSPKYQIWNNSSQKFIIKVRSLSTGKQLEIVVNFKYRLINKFK